MVSNAVLHYFRSPAEKYTIALFLLMTSPIFFVLLSINKYSPATVYCLLSFERISDSKVPSRKKLQYSKCFCSNQAITTEYQGLLWYTTEYLSSFPLRQVSEYI